MTYPNHPLFDPLADELRWCVHCGTDCWLEPDDQRHEPQCPIRTGLYPVTEREQDPAGGYGCCTGCSTAFELGDMYVLVDAATGVQAASPETGWVVCVGCGALGRDPREER